MNNIKIKLKWKLTLFTVLIMTITSGILVFSINYDVRHTVPQLKGIINSNTEDIKIDLNGDFKDEIDKISIESAIEETTSRIYWLSIIAFILVVTIGGMCTYFVVNNALIPIVELNKNIKIVLTNEKKRATIMTTTKKAKDKQKTTCQETRNPGRIEKSQRQGCKRN